MGNWRRTLASGSTWHRLASSGSGRLGTWRHWRQLESSGIDWRLSVAGHRVYSPFSPTLLSHATFHTSLRQLPGGLLGPWSSSGAAGRSGRWGHLIPDCHDMYPIKHLSFLQLTDEARSHLACAGSRVGSQNMA
eukprot:5555565-Prymnesium_polylepis.1